MNRYTLIGGLVILGTVGAMVLFWLLFFGMPSRPSSTSPESGSSGILPPSQPPETGQDIQAIAGALQSAIDADTGDTVRLGQVAVSNGWALWPWLGANTGGEALLKYDSSQAQWTRISDGGGAWSADDLAAFGVPTTTAQTLHAQVPH